MESQTDVDSIQELLQEVDQAWADHASNHTLQTLCERLENPMQQEDSATLRLQPVEGQTADVNPASSAG